MIQLSYQAAFDPYHAVFRMLRLRDVCWKASSIPFDKLRILDFYVAFPFFLQEMKLKREHTWMRKVSRTFDDRRPFAKLPDPSTLIRRMQPYQFAAMQGLVRREYASKEDWQKMQVLSTPKVLPADVLDRVVSANEESQDLIRAIGELSRGYSILGPDGLKARTGLLEHRYDAV